MRALPTAIVWLAACGGGLSATAVEQRKQDAETRTASSLAQSRDRYVAANHLQLAAAATTPGNLSAPTPTEIKQLSPREKLVELPAQGDAPAQLAMTYPSPCGGGCECDSSIQYAVATASDGSVVVLRLVATDHVTRVHQAGSCGYGCGMPQAPEPPVELALPTHDASRVRVEEVRYDRYVVDVRCDRMIPAP